MNNGKLKRYLVALTMLICAGLAAGCASSSAPAGAEPMAADHMGQVAREHAGDLPVAAAAAGGSALPEVLTQDIVQSDSGVRLRGYLAWPTAAERPVAGVLLLHEWWGLNDNIREMARRLASEGYIALAVDLYDGEVASDAASARALMEAASADQAVIDAQLVAAHRFLRERAQAPAVASLGWCFGGGMSLRTALLLPAQLDAAVVYYGRLVQEREQLATLEMPILGIFGAEDGSIPVEQVRTFENTLRGLGKEVTIEIYPGAGHAFANPSGTRYVPAAAEDAWARTLVFLRRHLGPGKTR